MTLIVVPKSQKAESSGKKEWLLKKERPHNTTHPLVNITTEGNTLAKMHLSQHCEKKLTDSSFYFGKQVLFCSIHLTSLYLSHGHFPRYVLDGGRHE